MTITPHVELRFNPTDLRPQDLPHAAKFLGSPADALEAALAVARARMVDQMKEEVRGLTAPTQSQLLQIADLAWQATFWNFRRVSAPIMADAYLRAYRRAEAGDVPISVIYDLADKHAEKIGDYFHTSSRDALADGFTTMVNRRVPAKAAADRVLDAYGLTPRQMRGYTSGKHFDAPVESPLPRSLKAKARTYIDRSFTTRTKKLSRQEEHNIDQQAQQFAWMWLQEKNRLSPKAQKMWITAKDERVCPVCGPLHGKKVRLNERFVTGQGEFWTPGLHPNCRCVVRLLENRFAKSLAGTELREFNQLHPRADDGRFGTKPHQPQLQPQPKPRGVLRPVKTIDVDTEFEGILAQPVVAPTRHITYATPIAAEAEPDIATQTQFAQLIEAQPEQRGFTSTLTSPLEVEAFKREALVNISATEPMLEFAADLAMDLRADARLRLQTKPNLKLTKTPTIALDKTAYAVIRSDTLHEGDISRIRLVHGIHFHTDEIGAVQEAGELKQRIVERHVEDMIDQLAKDKGRTVKTKDPETGEMYYADMRPKDIERIADWYGRTATRHHHEAVPEWFDEDDASIPNEEVLPLDWRDREGIVVNFRDEAGKSWAPAKMSYRELGQNYFDQRPQDYEVYVVGIDRVPTEEGAVEDISGSANSRYREFSVDGDYTLVPGSVGRTQAYHFYDATRYTVEPDFSVELPPEKSE
jgi:hypothetical protein